MSKFIGVKIKLIIMLEIKNYFKDNEHFNDVFGDIGNSYVKALSWLYTSEAVYGNYCSYYLKETIDTPTYMSCVNFFIEASKSVQPELTINDYILKISTRDEKEFGFIDTSNIITIKKINGKEVLCLSNIDNSIIETILWGALMYWRIQKEINHSCKNIEISFKSLYEALREQSGGEENVFGNHYLIKHIDKAMEVFKINYKVDNNKNTEECNIENKKTLKQYLEDPIYHQCYSGVVHVMGGMSRFHGNVFTVKDYAKIFEEAEHYVNLVLSQEYPEIEISNIQATLMDKYQNIVKGNVTTITKEREIGCLIEMIFIIVLWDCMEVKSDLVLDAFRDCRNYLENIDYPRIYTSNPLWKLIAQRIPYVRYKRKEDYEAEIEKLKENQTDENMGNEIEKIKAKLLVYEAESIAEKQHDKVRLETMRLILLKSGADLSTYGNKAKAGRFIHYLTSLPLQTCLNYLSDPNLNRNKHSKEVNNLNNSLTILS